MGARGVESVAKFIAVRIALLAALAACATSPFETPKDASAPRPALRVGVSGDYAPFNARSTDGGDGSARAGARGTQYVGFDADVARRFARDAHTEIAWVPFRWPDLADQLARGDFDVAMSGVTVRPERSVVGRFSVAVAEAGAVLLVRTAAAARARESADPLAALDRPEVRIGVNRGGHLERVARARFRRAEIRAIADNGAVRAALMGGEVDAVVTDTLEAPRWMGDAPGIALFGPFTHDRKAYLLPADAGDLAARLDAWLIAAEQDGTLARLRTLHFGPQTGNAAHGHGTWPATAEPLSALLAATDERLALMPFVADAKRGSGLEVVDPQREERVLAAAQHEVADAARRFGVAAPAPDLVRAFYRAQIDAAVDIQRAVLAAPDTGTRERFDLAEDLRPALLRIDERMTQLLVRTSGVSQPPDLAGRTTAALSLHALSQDRQQQFFDALRALCAGQPPPTGR